MAYFLFIDESGHDRNEAPYEVLAGLIIEDRNLWNLIQAAQDAEIKYFGMRYSLNTREIKGKKVLKRKTFKHASQLPPIPFDERTALAKEALTSPQNPTKRQLTALAQAKIDFVKHILELCNRYGAKAISSIVDKNSARPESGDYLRKDYAYLFERYFYFLEDMDMNCQGVVVFDELEKSQSHILLQQMTAYFLKTRNGRLRAGRIIPEPFFVHSDLSTGIQLADIIAYIINWGIRFKDMSEPVRAEISDCKDAVLSLRSCHTREINGYPNFKIWSFAYIDNLEVDFND